MVNYKGGKDLLDTIYSYFTNPYIKSDKDHSHDIVLIVPNAYCNLSCKYCYLNNCKSTQPPVFLEDKVLPVVSSFAALSGQVKVWAGEPLYNKELFIKICNFINKYLQKYDISIYTNGTLLDDWWADFFKDHKVNVFLSHDGPGQKYRGLDYFESETQKKAIKKIYNNNNLIGVSSVIHKQNCSFFDIVSYFNNIENNLDIVFNERVQTLVCADLKNNLPLNFEYMDKNLIQYVQDLFMFLLKELITGDKNNYSRRWVGWDTIKSYLSIFKTVIGFPITPKPLCDKSSESQLSVSSTGQNMCIYQAYSGARLTDSCSLGKKVDILKKCASCKIFNGCPVKGCQKLSIDDNFCKEVQNRYYTIEYAIRELLKQFGFTSK